MSTKKRSTSSVSSQNNFRLQNEFQKRGEGTKPLPKPVSIGETLLTMFLHGCRKVIFVNTNIKVCVYLGILFVSFLFDMFPFPRSYFSQSSNALNQYFVKLGWAWTLVVTLPFVALTSFTYCCGDRRMVGWHISRLGVATISWFVFTKTFAYLENNTGHCSVKGDKFGTKQACLSAGHFWHSLDISGHAFILIYSCLVIIEEARTIVGWDTIQNLIRNEGYNRSENQTDLSSPLKGLTDNQLKILKLSFKTFTPYVRGFFIAMTFLICLWDVMILSTALYFHRMVEKLIGGILAIIVWYLTYYIWFRNAKLKPYSPGIGIFQYNKPKAQTNGALPRRSSLRNRPDIGPTFMGMPLSSRQTDQEEEFSISKTPASKNPPPVPPPRIGPVTRSQVLRPDVK